MLLYSCDVNVKNSKFVGIVHEYEKSRSFASDSSTYSTVRKIDLVNEAFIQNFREEKLCLPLIYDMNGADDGGIFSMVIGVAGEKTDLSSVNDLIVSNLPGCKIDKFQEITKETYEAALSRGNMNNMISRNCRSIFDDLSLYRARNSIFEKPPFVLKEDLYLNEKMSYKICKNKAEDIMASDDFMEELARIYSRKNEKKYYGHPVHYLISAGDYSAAMDMIDILIPALRKNKRLLGGRVTQMRRIQPKAYKDEGFERFFESETGGTIIIDFSNADEIGSFATGFVDMAQAFGKMLERYGKDTLFIFVDVSGRSEMTGAAISAIQAHADMIHLTEGCGTLDQAVSYMKRIIDRLPFSYENEAELTKYLPEKASYTVSDIYDAFNLWYAKGIKSHAYRSYAEVDTMKIEVEKKIDEPYQVLQKMVGLTDVKRICDDIINSCKLEQVRKAMGFKSGSISKHMLFAGNPGTAKTTVARLLAQILKEEGVLDNGHLVECARQDLVGPYVGWTARIVRQKFKEARGGILFIDEAYALVDDSNTFGAEAINTIVQQMENYRDEVMVIFAGYTDKMKTFLEQNEGLNSRIAFHLDFPDYNSNELEGIMDIMLEDNGLHMTDDAREKCMTIYDNARTSRNYGNGRFVRNMLEQARMRQAARIMDTYKNSEVDKDVITELIADDFESPYIAFGKPVRMGF